MASSQDTEITLGTGKLLFLFFGLVAVCATFFALGYSLGRKSEPSITTASAAGSPQLVPGTTKATSGSPAAADSTTASAKTPPSEAADSATTLPTSGYFVQVAAVSKQEDGAALVEALKKKDYPAFVATPIPADKLFHVQVGPFPEIKDAEAMRARLIADGYSPILKK